MAYYDSNRELSFTLVPPRTPSSETNSTAPASVAASVSISDSIAASLSAVIDAVEAVDVSDIVAMADAQAVAGSKLNGSNIFSTKEEM